MEIEQELLNKELLLKENQKVLGSEEEEASLCVVCQDAKKVVALIPCGHVCLCEGCEHDLQKRRCPMCNKDYTNKFKVFY